MSIHYDVYRAIPKKNICYETKTDKNGESYKVIFKYISHIYVKGNKNGKHIRKQIGVVSNVAGYFHPNDFFLKENKYKLENNHLEKPSMEYYRPFLSFILNHIAYDLGIMNCLLNEFGNVITNQILSLCGMYLMGDSVGDSVDQFLITNRFPFLEENLTPNDVSDLYGFLGSANEKREVFQKEWVKAIKKDNQLSVYFDVTSISTYSKNMIEAEPGYNRDHEDLIQINLGMFILKDTNLPIAYLKYKGSLLDKVNLEYADKHCNYLELNKYILCTDGGFCFENCFNSLLENKRDFIIGCPNSRKVVQDLVDQHKSEISNYESKIPFAQEYMKKYAINYYNCDGFMHILLNPQRREETINDFLNKVAEEKIILEEYVNTKIPLKNEKFKYHTLTISQVENKKVIVSFKQDNKKISKELDYSGYTGIFTNLESLSTEVLEIYRTKDMVEKSFLNMKNYIDMNRMRVHSDVNADGKIFVTFISLVFRRHLENKLLLLTQDKTIKSILEGLKIICNISVRSEKGKIRLIAATSSRERAILEALGCYEDFTKYTS